VNQWALESFADLFKDLINLKHKIRELHPSVERNMKIARELEHAFAPYTMLYNEIKQKKKKKKQLPIKMFLLKILIFILFFNK
jgi:hypothetical protein